MEDPLQRIAALAHTLKEGELRCLLELARNHRPGQTIHRSSRELAQQTGLSRKNVQIALDSLNERGLIKSSSGSATRPAGHDLTIFDVPVLPGGVVTTPPVPVQRRLSDATPGVITTPPPGVVTMPPNPTRARVEIPIEEMKILDRVLLQTNTQNLDPALVKKARDRLHGHMRKFGAEPEPHPPDATIVAQFLAIAEWEKLDNVLMRLHREGINGAGGSESYGWFIHVALQRIHNIASAKVHERRAQLKELQRATSTVAIRELARKKAMR